MNDTIKKELQSAAFERLIKHLRERKDVQNLDLMNLAGFCRNCLSKWYREEAKKKGIEISDLKSRIDYTKGNASLVVTGTLVNQNTTKRAVPNIVVVIEDSKEIKLSKRVEDKIISFLGKKIIK